MTEPNLSEYTFVLEEANRGHIRHHYKHTNACTHRINVASISGEPLTIPVDDLVRKLTEHDAQCPWLRAGRWEPTS